MPSLVGSWMLRVSFGQEANKAGAGGNPSLSPAQLSGAHLTPSLCSQLSPGFLGCLG